MSNDVAYSSTITIAAKTGLNKAGLESLHDQTINFKVAGDLFIDDADFTIDEIRTDLNSSTVINVEKGDIDRSLVSISRIDVDDNNPAGITMNLKFEGVPAQINQLTISDLTIKLPDFIKISYLGNDAPSCSSTKADGKSWSTAVYRESAPVIASNRLYSPVGISTENPSGRCV